MTASRVARRIRESNIQAFLEAFTHNEVPSWFDKDFDIKKTVNNLYSLHLVNVAVAISVSKHKKKKRKVEVSIKLFHDSVTVFEGYDI